MYAEYTTSEEIGPVDDRRVHSRSDVANTGELNKTEIAQYKKKSSNTANDEVAHGASMSPVAMRLVCLRPFTLSTDDQYTRSIIEYIVISSSDSEQELDDTYSPIVGHGAPLNSIYPIPNPKGGSGGGGEGSQYGGSGDAEQNANHTIRVLGVDIPYRKDTVITNTEDGNASGRPAADGSLPMHDSDVSRQPIQPASTGTGDGASSNNQEPLAYGRGESSMRRHKSRLRLLDIDSITQNSINQDSNLLGSQIIIIKKQGNARTAAVQRPLPVPCITNPLTPSKSSSLSYNELYVRNEAMTPLQNQLLSSCRVRRK
ncbi:hypothetical protein Tco_0634998 [Tanacetum coccineum]